MKNQIERISQQQFDQHMRVLIARHMAPSLSVIDVDGSGETRHYYHLGNAGRFLNEVRLYPELNYGIAVLGNVTSYDTSAITSMIVSTENGERSQQTATGIS